MIDSRNNFSPRFIHMPDTYCDAGATVAYVRDIHHVFFAWSQLNPKDTYNKSIGRNVTSNRLKELLPELILKANVKQSLIFKESRIGFISIAQLISKETCVGNVIADHMLATLTPMDFKHSYITGILEDIVCDNLF